MRANLLVASLIAATALPALTALPTAASAQGYSEGCVQSNRDNHAAGTVLGAIGGAVLGGAVAGRHDRGAGVALGAVGGAVAGNAISRSQDHPCPDGYYYAPQPYGASYAAPRGDFWAGAPTGIRARMDFMQDRINTSANNAWISPREAARANRELAYIRSENDRLRYQDGGHLRPVDRDYLQSRLDSLSQRLNWAEHSG
jgi:hypothetical protein